MLDKRGKLQSIEGALQDLLHKLGAELPTHRDDVQEYRRQLVRAARSELGKLDKDDAAAMSMEADGLSAGQLAAVRALERRMGVS